TVARLTITDAAGHVFPPQPKRLGQDFFFQKQIYRADGGIVLLPPGNFTVETGRGPEYKVSTQKISVSPADARPGNFINVKLQRWINPMDAGLLNLRDQTYPGSAGTKVKGWPTWTTPLMKWAKDQDAVTGYAHSANGLGIDPKQASARLFAALDANADGNISREEAGMGKWPLI